MNLSNLEAIELCADTVALDQLLLLPEQNAQFYHARHYLQQNYPDRLDESMFFPLPHAWNKVFQSRWVEEQKVWICTISLTDRPDTMVTFHNTVASKAPSFHAAFLAASLRAVQRHWELRKQ